MIRLVFSYAFQFLLFVLMLVVVYFILFSREKEILDAKLVVKLYGPSAFNEKHPLHIIDIRNSHFCIFRMQIIVEADLAAKIISKAVIFFVLCLSLLT